MILAATPPGTTAPGVPYRPAPPYGTTVRQDLHSNHITKIQCLNHLHALRVLNLAGNKIRKLEEVRGLESLTELNLRRNRLELLDGTLDSLVSLQRLFLSHNCLPSLGAISPALISLPHLVELSVEVRRAARVCACVCVCVCVCVCECVCRRSPGLPPSLPGSVGWSDFVASP